ncbi:MAG: nickel-responsive transcriptional regulator NikR [Oceanospirillaceae bacterium]|nr:nickel-responsive transcriptional regulator NikR [Oceanospirillaceae bacterium]
MERLTISLDSDLAQQFDEYLKAQGYSNRSEGMRDLIREKLEQQSIQKQQEELKSDANCIGSITYIYDHQERELASKLAKVQHDHHNIAISSLRIPLDHHHCMETIMLNGQTSKVRAFCNEIIAKPGIRHGKAYLVPVEVKHSKHEGQDHIHNTPQN